MAMLKNVVAEGTGTLAARARLPGRRQDRHAAKPDPQGGYSDSNYVASFVGIVPASRPRLVILVSVDEPRGAIWGGVVAAPAFAQIAKFDLQYLDGAPAGRARDVDLDAPRTPRRPEYGSPGLLPAASVSRRRRTCLCRNCRQKCCKWPVLRTITARLSRLSRW